MQYSYSIEFHVFSDSSDTSRGIYQRAVFMTVSPLYPEVFIQGKTVAINQ